MQTADSFEKTLMLRKTEGRRRRGWQDEMVGWHHWLDGHGFGWTLGVGDGQGGLACCGSWGLRVRQNWVTELNWWWIQSDLLHLLRLCPTAPRQCLSFISKIIFIFLHRPHSWTLKILNLYLCCFSIVRDTYIWVPGYFNNSHNNDNFLCI